MKRVALIFALCSAAFGQVAKEANSGYQTKEGRQGVAAGLSAPDRDAKQKPQELVDAMSIRPGMVVADIGTGVGYMLPYLSKAVGPEGSVLAQDIAEDFLAQAAEKAQREKLANVSFVKGTETDPKLPENGVDIALALDSYHHYDYPEQMLAAIHKSLRAGGKFVVVEYYKSPNAMPNGRAMKHIRLDEPDVIKEIEANHFQLVSKREHVKGSQYMLVFQKN